MTAGVAMKLLATDLTTDCVKNIRVFTIAVALQYKRCTSDLQSVRLFFHLFPVIFLSSSEIWKR
jgi:hypothetical protein